MDDLAWDRCPDCLGLLEPLEAGDGSTAFGCIECAHLGEQRIEIPDRRAPHGPAKAWAGF